MKRTFRLIGVVIVGLLPATAAFGQSEKINLRMAPAPGQTVRMTMAQDMDTDITLDSGAAPPGLLGPMKMVMRNTMTMTEKIGPRKPDGSVDAELTYNEIKMEMSLNGQPLPIGDAAQQLANRTVTVTYNRDGEVIATKGLPDGAGMTDDTVKQMMNSFYGNLPTASIGVGEEVSVPINFNLPLPLPGAGPMKMAMAQKTKLVSIENSGGGRVARLESSTDGKMGGDIPSPDGKSGMKLDFVITGGGTTVMDLAKGVMRSGLITVNMNGTIDMGSAAPAGMPPMRMRAVMTMTMASE